MPRSATRRQTGEGAAPRSSQDRVTKASSSGGPPARRRCAVYTRKSSEEGLEQEYNSLHAQREACEAYIRSQQHEGWRLVPDAYDDGGISGATMDRPGLQALLAAIAAGRIDTVVVYKVDRLTRSLADFAKMVEVFDAHGASFVAVTQQFNTTTSMGRLTLNILLSFAQFEREVTGERIRDKIAASKQRGMWMGGTTPLGYEVQDRKLVVVPEDAAMVVHLYQRYLALGCVRQLRAELAEQGLVTKRRQFSTGRITGGTSYARGALYALLSNPIYVGQIRHKTDCYQGQHAAIVPDALFASVQSRLAASNNGVRGRPRAKVEPSLLAGKLFDERGERLVPSHARKGERRYRYYVSASLLAAGERAAASKAGPTVESGIMGQNAKSRSSRRSTPPGWRVPAREIEQAVQAAVDALLRDRATLATALLVGGAVAAEIPDLLDGLDARGRTGPATLRDGSSLPAWPGSLLQRVDLSTSSMALTLAVPCVGSRDAAAHPSDASPVSTIRHRVPHRISRRGMEMRMVIETTPTPQRDDAALLKMIARAHCWFEELVSGRTASALAIAHRLGVKPRYVQRLLPLALMAPSLVEQIVEGRHPAGLTAEWLQRNPELPWSWAEQAASLR